MRFNRDLFTKRISSFYGQTLRRQLNPATLSNIETLLFLIELDTDWKLTSEIAYFLATIGWETAWTFAPIVEKRASTSQPEVRRMQDKYWHTKYFGRGYVQLTWKENYKKMSPIVGVDLVKNPNALLQPSVSYEVASVGMRQGMFRAYPNGRPVKLSDYINASTFNFVQARNVINSDTNKNGAAIAKFASAFLDILNASLIKDTTSNDTNLVVSVEHSISNIPESNNETPVINNTAITETPLNTAPWATPIQVDPTVPTPTAGPKSLVTTISSIISSLGVTGGAFYGYISGLVPNLNPTVILIICLVCIAAITCTYIITRIYIKNARENRAALLDMQRVEITADPNKVNVICESSKVN